MMIDPRYLDKLNFRCIGPTRGGRVVAVTGDPHNPAVFYFGACAGGVWKSEDAGQYWECVSDGFFNTSAVGALAIAPSDSNVLYAGTGETTIRIDVSHGDGVYRTTDAGKTWTHTGLKETRYIGKIRVHPHDPDTVYVAALGDAFQDNPERGVFRSTDGGKTWEHVLFVHESAGAVDVTLDPNNPRVLFASFWQARRSFWSIDSGGPYSGIWRSTDGGDTWENISAHKGLPTGTMGKIGVAISPAQSGRVWAVIEAEGRKRGLYRSDDNGDTWELVCDKTQLSWRPWYYMHVVAHPTDPETVWVMNQKAWQSNDGGRNFDHFQMPHGDTHDLWVDPSEPSRMIGSDDGGAFVTHNSGRSWSTIYNQLTAQFYHLAVDNENPYNVYGTQQDNSSICVPSRTGTGAITWGDCYPPGTGESGYIAPHPEDANIVYVGAIGSSPGGGDSLQRYDHRTGQTQLITIWPEDCFGAEDARYRFQWTYPIVFDPHDSGRLYAAGNIIFRTLDEGQSWQPVSPDLTYADPETLKPSGKPLTHDIAGAEMYATVFAFAGCRHEQGVFWAGSDDGRVHITRDDCASWQEVTPSGLPKFSQVTMIETSPHQAGKAYMTVARHKMGDYAPYVYVTEDYGTTWTLRTDGLPKDDFCRVVREDPDRPGLLYLGLEQGLYVSFDDGANWQSMQGNLPISPVYDLVAKHGDLVIATHGRSFWVLDDLSQIHQLNKQTANGEDLLFRPKDAIRAPLPIFADLFATENVKSYHVTLGQNATFVQTKDETGFVSRRMLDAGSDPQRGVVIRYWLAEKPKEALALTILDAQGREVSSYTSEIPEKEDDRLGVYLPAEDGMNVFVWPMTLPYGEKMNGSEVHKPMPGPLALPGDYQVRLAVNGRSFEQPFRLITEPNVKTTGEVFQVQFEFLKRIQEKNNVMTRAVNQLRSVRNQVEGWIERTASMEKEIHAQIKAASQKVLDGLASVERELVQVEFLSEWDSLNFPPKLIEKMGMLPSVVGGTDNPPTRQSYEVFEKYSSEADVQLGRLGQLMENELEDLNGLLAAAGVSIVMP